MILNARMYSPTPEIAGLWRRLLGHLAELCGGALELYDYPPPQPLSPLWSREDKAAVFMCGLPFSLARPRPVAVVAPITSVPGCEGEPVYWSELVVRADSRFETLADTFGGTLALTTLESQSGCVALLDHLVRAEAPAPPFAAVHGPTVTFLANLQAVRDGHADIAPIDSYGFALLQRHHPELTADVRVIARTPSMPSPLLVGSATIPGLTQAFEQLHSEPGARALMNDLLVDRFAAVAPADYEALAARRTLAFQHWRTRPLSRSANPAFEIPGED